jgi:hypothetical protein
MIPLSCANCWHNPLQHDSVGLAVGFCVIHKKVLNSPESTTCGRQRRKDLPLDSARREQAFHREGFDEDTIVLLRDRKPANGSVSDREPDIEELRHDAVGEAVTEYGQLGAKIESIARLSKMSGVRAELAMLSLGRAYLHNCVARKGSWTSGIHMFWWNKERLAEEPEIGVEDLWQSNTLPLHRKVELARWAVIMLRLTFVADVATHAAEEGHPLQNLRAVLDEAAEAVGTFNTRRLLSWVKSHALRQITRALPTSEYYRLAHKLHQET